MTATPVRVHELIPELGCDLYEVPNNMAIPDDMDMVVLWEPQSDCAYVRRYPAWCDANWLRRASDFLYCTRYTLTPLAPPLPTRPGAIIRDGEGVLRLAVRGTRSNIRWTLADWGGEEKIERTPQAVEALGPWTLIYPGPEDDIE